MKVFQEVILDLINLTLKMYKRCTKNIERYISLRDVLVFLFPGYLISFLLYGRFKPFTAGNHRVQHWRSLTQDMT